MKTCPWCSSTAFDDMTICYGCLQHFDDNTALFAQDGLPINGSMVTSPVTLYPEDPWDDLEDDMTVEEPSGRPPAKPAKQEGWQEQSQITQDLILEKAPGVYDCVPETRLHVMVSELFGYDIYLRKEEGAELTIGCARDNNIVLPHTESCRHLLRLFHSNGGIWVQDRGSRQKAQLDKIPLTGTRAFKQGAVLQVGEAQIELIEV